MCVNKTINLITNYWKAGLLVAGLVLGLSPSFANAQTIKSNSWAEVNASKSGDITIVYYPEEAFAFKDGRGNYSGVELDILQQFLTWLRNAKGVQINVNWIEQPDFEKLYNTVKTSNSGVFGAGNITITEERRKELKFSPAYMNNIAVLMTHSSVPDLNSLDNISTVFKNMTATVHKGTTHVNTVNDLKTKYFPNLVMNLANSDAEAISAVISNPKTFTYTDLANYWVAQKSNEPVKRHSTGDKTTEQFGFIMPLNSDWDTVFHEFFSLGSGYRSNITYKKILMRHLGSEVTQMLEMAQAQQASLTGNQK